MQKELNISGEFNFIPLDKIAKRMIKTTITTTTITTKMIMTKTTTTTLTAREVRKKTVVTTVEE